MEGTTPLHVTNHYRRNKDEYDEIRSQLTATREAFHEADISEQVRMLQKSHSSAVISVQTPVHIYEDAFTQLWENDSPIQDLDESLSSVNYRNQKAEYITHSLQHGHLWAKVANMLDNGNIDEAHKFILDEFKGVGPAKAPFTLAMLGFTEKMCVDANVINAMGLDEHVNTVVVEKYENICSKLRDKMPTLRDETTPFVWQWIVFDWQRGEISHHKPIFKVLGTLQ